jgi:hypothetical protein
MQDEMIKSVGFPEKLKNWSFVQGKLPPATYDLIPP